MNPPYFCSAIPLSSSEKINLTNALSAYLGKAEALALIIATTDLQEYNLKTISDYLWALSDLIKEAKCLHDKQNLLTLNN